MLTCNNELNPVVDRMVVEVSVIAEMVAAVAAVTMMTVSPNY